jgi:hypothetical protein
MKITLEKNVPQPPLKSVTITMSPEQAAVLMLMVGATNRTQKEAIVFRESHNNGLDVEHLNELKIKLIKIADVIGVGDKNGYTVNCVDEIYVQLSKMFAVAANDGK